MTGGIEDKKHSGSMQVRINRSEDKQHRGSMQAGSHGAADSSGCMTYGGRDGEGESPQIKFL